MKKLVSWLLMGAMLAALLCASVGAQEEPPAAAPRPVGETKLENLETLPVGVSLISKDLLAPSIYSQYSYTVDSLTDEQQWEIGRYLHYGFSAVGVSALERSLAGAVDGVWATGNTGDKLQNGSKARGAIAYKGTPKTYNYLGETGQDDSIYQIIFTFNFGKLAELNSIGFVGGNPNNMPQAADVYTSCDGENWTLVGYWDRTAARMNGDAEMKTVDASLLGKDKTEAEYSAGKIMFFDLKNTEAQFLRICGVSHSGTSSPSNPEDYATYANTYDKSSGCREIVVYGTLLEKENHVTAVEKPYQGSGEGPGEETDDPGSSKVPDIPVKPTGEASTQKSETPGTSAPTDTAESKQDGKGCRSAAGGVSLIALFALGGGLLMCKRKRK